MSNIKHKGTITNIQNYTLTVKIHRTEACSSCAIKSACQLKDNSGQTIYVSTTTPKNYQIGQIINLEISTPTGFCAVFYAYTLPLLIMLSTLFISLNITSNELTAGIFSIFILIPYYSTLFLCKKYINKKFSFKISEK